MTSIYLNNNQNTSLPLFSADKSVGNLPPSVWQNVMHYIPPKECAQMIHSVCSSWKDIMPDHGDLDLSGLNIRGTDLARIIEACAKKGPIHSLNLANCMHITDDDLACLSNLSLKNLSLDGCNKITDKGLAHLAKLPLRALSLSKCTEITDRGLAFLQGLPLNILDLGSCSQITDQGIAHFKNMSLNWLNLYECFRITDQGIKHLLLSNSIDRLFFCFPLTGEKMLAAAVNEEDIALVKKLLSCKVAPDPSKDPSSLAPLYIAARKENVRLVELLLQAGADPNRTFNAGLKPLTPYELAVSSKNLILASAFFSHSLPHLKPRSSSSIARIILGLDNSGIKPRELDPGRLIAKGLPSLCPISNLRVLSPYVSSDLRSSAVQYLVGPLLQPFSSVQPLIAPLQNFAARETREDPHFAVYVTPSLPHGEDNLGSYSHIDGTINLFVQNHVISKDEPAVLLHELSHKAWDKLRWNAQENQVQTAGFASDAAKDIEALKQDHWQHCHSAVRSMLEYVEEDYPPSKQFEEYLVRIPEILTQMAQEPSKPSCLWIEKRIQKDLPCLYDAIYTKEFLPRLDQYCRRH